MALRFYRRIRVAPGFALNLSKRGVFSLKICFPATGGDRVTDFHLWQIGPGHLTCIVALVSDTPRSASVYKTRLAGISGLSHVTVEVELCLDPPSAFAPCRLSSLGMPVR